MEDEDRHSSSSSYEFWLSGVARAHLRANTDAIGAVAAGIAANRACVLYRWLLVGALWARARARGAAKKKITKSHVLIPDRP